MFGLQHAPVTEGNACGRDGCAGSLLLIKVSVRGKTTAPGSLFFVLLYAFATKECRAAAAAAGAAAAAATAVPFVRNLRTKQTPELGQRGKLTHTLSPVNKQTAAKQSLNFP